MIEDYDIVGSFNDQRITGIDAERSVNLFQYIDPLGKKKKSLIYTSGLINTELNFSGVTGGFRAEFVFNDINYCVCGNSFLGITQSGVVSILGNLVNTNSGYVGIDANTFQVAFVDGVNGYIWDTIANTFTMITDSHFPTQPLDICNLDGFFVVVKGSTNNFYLSSFNQGLVWGSAATTFTADVATNLLTVPGNTNDFQTGVEVTLSTTGTLPDPLNNTDNYFVIRVSSTTFRLATSLANALANIPIVITTAGGATNTMTGVGALQQGAVTTHPGTVVACRTLHRRLFLFSQNFTEVWENAGIGRTLPFRRNNSLLIEYGTPCVGSISVSFDIMIFLSQTKDGLGPVMQVSGTQARPISTNSLDQKLAGYAAANQISDCRGFLIKENGLIFYRMNFTGANHTWVYNVSLSDPTSDATKLWHEEEVLNGDRHPAQTHAYFNGKNYVGHYDEPILYLLDSQTYTNDGETIRRMRIGKPIGPSTYQRTRIDRFQLDLLQGNVNNSQTITANIDLLTEDSMELDAESGEVLIGEETRTIELPIAPVVFLSFSKDGGQTYGYNIRAPMGNVGQRSFRTLWRKLGTIPRGQYFVPKIEFFDQIPFVILGASWAYEILPE